MLEALPPVITREDFARLRDCPRRLVQAEMKAVAVPLRAYLNSAPQLQQVQAKRQEWRQGRLARQQFGDFSYRDGFWELYHYGGKQEVQLNVAMNPRHLRLGLGFDFGLNDRGSREMVAIAYAYLCKRLRQAPEEFSQAVLENAFSLEYLDYPSNFFKVIPTAKTAEFFLNLPKNHNPKWLFLGKLLTPDTEHEILATPARLHQVCSDVFAALLTYWEDANRYAYSSG